MIIGDKVKVMYPYDSIWWETEGIVIDKIEDQFMIMNMYKDKILIDYGYLEKVNK